MLTEYLLTEEAIAQAKASDAVLMGSIGGDAKTSPWYKLEPSKRPEAGLLAIRKALNLLQTFVLHIFTMSFVMHARFVMRSSEMVLT